MLFARRQFASALRTIGIVDTQGPMTRSDLSLPPELDALASYLDAQIPDVRELFQYALARLMIEAGATSQDLPVRYPSPATRHWRFRA
jgi:hypothetical protein